MKKLLHLTLLATGASALLAPATACALAMTPKTAPAAFSAAVKAPKFTFKDGTSKPMQVDVIDSYARDKITRPLAKVDRSIDPRLMRAATIAQERAHAHSRRMCWHAVKEALVASGVVESRPKSEFAKEAGRELVQNYGFKRLNVSDPYQAPVGSVLVYNASRSAGHVEIRTKDGFVSDFRSKTPSHRPLLGVYAKS